MTIHAELQRTLGEIAARQPGATRVFFAHGLDFCCKGNQTLIQAAQAKGLDVTQLASELSAIGGEVVSNPADLDDVTLIAYILDHYHADHRAELPELIRLASKVELVHADHPACPHGLAEHLEQMEAELLAHMDKEEQILFPMIQNGLGAQALMPMQVMMHEHVAHGEALEQLDVLSHQQTPPAEACRSWQALYTGVRHLKEGLMQHIHLENHVLFARYQN